MDTYVLDLGVVAFDNWLQVYMTVVVSAYYILTHAVPAFDEFFLCLSDKELRWIAPLDLICGLLPVIGAVKGMCFFSYGKKMEVVLLVLTYLLLFGVIAGFAMM